ncbi:hypothetical protein H2248_011907 [Termitomyces sp. 'cryptogamus']|nr:hypothetical protein H2248_011907 [Termitomyces sp. 'cryptogamus']
MMTFLIKGGCLLIPSSRRLLSTTPGHDQHVPEGLGVELDAFQGVGRPEQRRGLLQPSAPTRSIHDRATLTSNTFFHLPPGCPCYCEEGQSFSFSICRTIKGKRMKKNGINFLRDITMFAGTSIVHQYHCSSF